MNSIIGLLIAFVLVAGLVAIAIPNMSEATPSHRWCTDVGASTICYPTHHVCSENAAALAGASKCYKQ